MYGIFGLSLINNGWSKSKCNTAEERCKSFFSSKFIYIKENVLRYQLLGITHMRLPNLISFEDIEVIQRTLEDSEFSYYKDMFFGMRNFTFSFHTTYKCSNVSSNNYDFLKIYFTKLLQVTDFLGITNLHIILHVNKNSYEDIIKTLSKLRNDVNPNILQLICLENTEYGLDIKQCLDVATCTGNPVVFDNFHNLINGQYILDERLVRRIKRSWNHSCLIPKIHFSNGDLITHKHNSILDQKVLMDELQLFSQEFNNLIIMLEFKYSMELLLDLKYENWDWRKDFIVNI